MKDASDGRETTKLQSPRVPSFEMWVAFVLLTPITFFFVVVAANVLQLRCDQKTKDQNIWLSMSAWDMQFMETLGKRCNALQLFEPEFKVVQCQHFARHLHKTPPSSLSFPIHEVGNPGWQIRARFLFLFFFSFLFCLCVWCIALTTQRVKISTGIFAKPGNVFV